MQTLTKEKILQSLVIKEAGQLDLLFFSKYIEKEYSTPDHINLIADKLTAVSGGTIKRLIISAPPRHGKSLLAAKLFPIWYLGKNPTAQIIVSAYGANLAYDFTRWQKNIVQMSEYQDIFPDIKLKPDSKAVERWETVQGGTVIGSGAGGAITGRGADLAVIDDPLKGMEEAMSETVKNKIWDWYLSVLRTRLHPGGAIIIIMTRWSLDDLVGRLLHQEAGEWEVLTLPAINEAGQALWPERYPISELEDLRRSLGEKIFSSLYQQTPVEFTEQLFSEPIYEEPPEGLQLKGYLDPALGGSDFSALTIGAKEGNNFYIVAGHIWQGQIDKTYAKTEQIIKQYNCSSLTIESNAAQRVIAVEMRKREMVVHEKNNIKNKHLRIVDSVLKNWLNIKFSKNISSEYMSQLLSYHEDAKHEDAPDSLAGLIDVMTAPVFRMRWV